MKKTVVIGFSLFASFFLSHCSSKIEVSQEFDPSQIEAILSESPVYSPEEAMDLFVLDEGLTIDLVAAEPQVEDPVAIDFDEQGRIWVAEMRGYMPDSTGSGEDEPVGRIKIIWDEDGDGRMESSKIVQDQLVMPRALRLVYGGILYAEPPNLIFAKLRNDSIISTEIVDSEYAIGGNVEHQPNGLLIGLDNWIYSAKSTKRYKRKQGKWIIEPTEFRGQWGIAKDERGNLFYNDNSNQLRGDFYPPNSLPEELKRTSSGVGVQIVENQSVYPIRPTPGINRGYMPQMLDSNKRLTRFTAACGPLIYYGQGLGSNYEGNAFVAEPSGNLVKRNVLEYPGFEIKGEQAYADREFLSSYDERFRPVNLYNGPNGDLYVVDMYRGIIQHATYITDYLRSEISSRDLSTPLGLGRIYRIRANSAKPKVESSSDYVELLKSKSMWHRDYAQRMIIEENKEGVEADLIELISGNYDLVSKIHAIWTLEGLSKLPDNLFKGVRVDNELLGHYLRATRSIEASDRIQALDFVLNSGDARLLIAGLNHFSAEYTENRSSTMEIIDAVEDLNLRSDLKIMVFGANSVVNTPSLMDSIVVKKLRFMKQESLVQEGYEKGYSTYSSNCATCHGPKGRGIPSLAPPLVDSEWVGGSPKKLAAILLFGMEGPVEVNGVLYEPPAVTGVMPGLGSNTTFSDEDFLELIRFLKKNFANQEWELETGLIRRTRVDFEARTTPLTAQEITDYSK